MKYMGSKARIAKEILTIILKNRKHNQFYIEPFVGGCNSIDKVLGKRIGNDANMYLIAMWQELQKGWQPPNDITKELNNQIKDNKDKYPPYLVGWVGFNCNYSGKWFGGFAGQVHTKIGTIRDYQVEAYKNTMAQVSALTDVIFTNYHYTDIPISDTSIIYCDPPYEGTTKYKDNFDHKAFWQWCRNKHLEGHSVFISEYNAPADFQCIWEKEVKSSLSANGRIGGGNKNSIEKLFIYGG